mmetsp:Transcript_34094/g.109400  ORF Transcript_34094/g.109400 Transcript_34094/m.109400 type:complete len:423 (+) Transcript_34094:122-1390(+)
MVFFAVTTGLLVLLLSPLGALGFAPWSSAAPTTPRLSAAALEGPPVAAADLSGQIPDCPLTIWDAEKMDFAKEITRRGDVACPFEWKAPKGSEGAAYFEANRAKMKATLLKHGCVWLRGFDLAKDEGGFRSMYEALNLEPCLDPIHTSGLRSFASERDAVYEEVNKQSLSRHYIGLHQESTHKKTATYGAFVCFQPATVEGGEFLIADAAKILADLDPKIRDEIYAKEIRISVSNLDLDFLPFDFLKDFAKKAIDTLVAPKFDMDLDMIFGSDGKPNRLQAVEKRASPVNRHPITKEPLWFCNIHNHARYLRDNRPCNVPEVGMTEVYYGDLSPIPHDVLDHVNAVSEKNIKHIPMQPGDVLLCDNYRILHGRDVFTGDRYHAVSWFKDGFSDQKKAPPAEGKAKPGNFLNSLINKALVDSF